MKKLAFSCSPFTCVCFCGPVYFWGIVHVDTTKCTSMHFNGDGIVRCFISGLSILSLTRWRSKSGRHLKIAVEPHGFFNYFFFKETIMPTHIWNYLYRTHMSNFPVSEIQAIFIFWALNTLEYVSSFFFSLFLQIFQNFYNKCLCSFHRELTCSQVGMMALNITVKKLYLYFENIHFF